MSTNQNLPFANYRKVRKALRRLFKVSRLSPPGAPPGTIAVAEDAPKPTLTLTRYNADVFFEETLANVGELARMKFVGQLLWLNVDGLGDGEQIKEIGKLFQIHPLTMEDVVNVHQRPKVEYYDDYTFIAARMLSSESSVETEQVSFMLRKDLLITFQELPGGDTFESVRQRLKNNRGRLRQRGLDYLAHALLDSVIDAFFPVLEKFSDRLEELEMQIVLQPSMSVLNKIHGIKQDLLVIKRCVWPLRDALNMLVRDSEERMTAETKLYLRDCYDHVVQIIELVETYRELCADLVDIHLSSLSYKMNEVMKLLTIIATIFIPLTFIVGVYGMNFHTEISPWNMPELNWHYGYPVVMCSMLGIAIGMLAYFRYKKWV